ncbi:MAG: hypothetical protein LC687_08240, partial [Actinobacteria bacterium]|nr:hypothetical protein [Actinomycetota bacterium]
DALDNDVRFDARIVVYKGSKLKAYCEDTGTYVQFPTDLRRYRARFIADVVKAKRSGGKVFYRAYKGSIRDAYSGKVVG